VSPANFSPAGVAISNQQLQPPSTASTAIAANMARSQLIRPAKPAPPAKRSHSLLRVDDTAVDPALASLFATSVRERASLPP